MGGEEIIYKPHIWWVSIQHTQATQVDGKKQNTEVLINQAKDLINIFEEKTYKSHNEVLSPTCQNGYYQKDKR